MKKWYTTAEVRNILGVSLPAFHTWTQRFLTPSSPSPGQGSAAFWSFDDIVVASVFKRMLHKGLKRDAAAALLNNIRKAIANGERRFVAVEIDLDEIEKQIKKSTYEKRNTL